MGQGQHTALVVTGCHIAAGEHDGGNVYTQCAHDHAGNDLVAGGHHDHALQHVQLCNGLNLTGDHVTGGQGVAVAGGVAADAVADTGNGQLQGQTAGLVNFLFHLGDELLVKGEMAGVHFVPAVDQANDGALNILLADAHGVQQCVAVIQGLFVPLADFFIRHVNNLL